MHRDRRLGVGSVRVVGTGGGALVSLLLLLAPIPASAQAPVALHPIRGLTFSALLPSTPVAVRAGDEVHGARWELRGTGSLSLSFDLPAALVQRDGRRIQLRFGPGDGRIVFPRSALVIEFDPRSPVVFTIPAGSGGAVVCIGGTAVPDGSPAPGRYSAAITARVAALDNSM